MNSTSKKPKPALFTKAISLTILAIAIASLGYGWHRVVSAQNRAAQQGDQPLSANGMIAFQRGFGGTAHIIAVASSGGAEADYGVGQDPSWRADGATMLFNTNSQLWIMNDKGTNRRQVTDTNGIPIGGEFASFSPDGNKIVFVKNSQSGFPGNVYKMDFSISADGTSVLGTNLLQLTTSGGASYPAWQPGANGTNGGLIAYQFSLSGNAEIYTMSSADGSGQTNITNNAASDRNPNWSPDGSKIVFASLRATPNNGDIWTMNPDGSGLVQLTSDTYEDGYPAYSPAGDKIVFSSGSGRNGASNDVIFTMSANGSGVVGPISSTGFDTNPSWQPVTALPHIVSFSKSGPTSAGGSITFSAATDPALAVRVQSSTTPSTEASWTDLPDGNGAKMHEDSAGNYSLTTTAYPVVNGVYFRAISSKTGLTDGKSDVIGPYDLASLPHITSFAVNGPTSPGGIAAFAASTYSGVTVRIQSTTTPTNEGSWADLPDGNSGHMHEDTPGNYSLATTAYPIANGIYFRAVSSKSGFTDGKSDVFGPYNFATLLHIASFSKSGPTSPGGSIGFGAGTSAGLIVRIQSTTTPANEGSWADLPDGNSGHMHEDTPGNYSLTTTAYPYVNGLYFRAVSSKTGFTDGKSDVLGPFDLSATISDLELRFNPNSTPPTTLHLGQGGTYSILVNNNGPSKAFSVTVSGSLPSTTVLDTGTSGFCTRTSGGFSCSLGDLDPSPTPHATSGTGVIILSLVLKAGDLSSITLTPTVSLDTSKSVDNVSTNNSATTTASVVPDLQLIGLEVTQGIQDLQNSVPLVAGKHTYVRAYVKASSAGSAGLQISGYLTAKNLTSGSILGTIADSNVGITIPVKQTPDRGILNESLYFELPYAWVQGNMQFEVGVNQGALTCSEPDGTPDCKASVNFQQRKALTIRFLPTTWTDSSNKTHTATTGDVAATINELLGIFPISTVTWDMETATTTLNPCDSGQFGGNTTGNLVSDIQGIHDNECPSGTTCKQFYLALVADQNACSVATANDLPLNGQAFGIPGTGAVAFTIRNSFGNTGFANVANPAMDFNARAHELSHASGNRHTLVRGDEKGPNTSFTPSNGSISPDTNPFAADTAYGFDVNNISSSRVYAPNTADFMSYARPRWVSVYNYNRLFSFVGAPSGSTAAKAEPIQVAATKIALIRGGVFQSGAGISPLYVTNSNGSVTLPTPGTYAIRFSDSQGNQLSSYSFEPQELTETEGSAFSLSLPWDGNTKRVELLHNGSVIASRQASANAPVVNVTAPNGGEVLNGNTTTLSWSATDADADSLLYLVEYSPDAGTTWRTLAVDWKSASLPVDLTKLPGSNQALIRVAATDGFNSSQDQSDAIFTVGKHVPESAILTPENNRLYVANQTIVLKGLGFDMEDGVLTGSSLTWNSSLNGSLGSGDSIAVDASTLQEGTHVITLGSRDSDGQTGSATISIVVARTRPQLPTTLSVSPAGLLFQAAPASGLTPSQSIAIRNSGDGNLSWSASVDQSWLQINQAGGSAPFSLSVSANVSGLPVGQYSGNVQITASGSASSPQTVPVTLLVGSLAPALQFSVASFAANEGAGATTITVTRTGSTSSAASVRYATSDGTAKEGKDYTAAYGVLNFAAGETSKTFPVLIIDNAFAAGTRTVNLTLSNPTGATLAAQSTAVLSISDNDTSTGPTNPIDTSRFFVQEHYYDFLGRYPDQGGWDFWTNNINNCTPKPSCVDTQRINTSAAYFLSIEFQQTGYLVERIYKTAYGSGSGTSVFGGTHQFAVPIVRFSEFLPDTQQIGAGVVVGQGDWQTALENNKQAFTADFVQRSRFTTAFPTTMTPTQFVDKLNTNAGNVLSASDRTTLIALFGSATDTSNVTARAQAVRQVAENATLNTQEFNRAFVLMQYFGYLRRDPNGGQDTDYTGFDFWLTKLNQFNGNYNAAEMVKAFITSTEYRQRFGP